ncbi:MAG: DNA repair protein RecN [Candidatus Rokubacteria bacterium]|nr:DNA repair protein RecN [Candidatus Rokubacteria bacterium]
MLRELRIKNFAVIETATVELAPGLNVLTGETGAGKSMLIDAILLVRGVRAQLDVIRTDADTATVEARFEVAPGSPARAVLDEAGLAAEDGEILVRRELARSGRHRAFVNDSPVTVTLLERLGDHLVEVHGQHEHHRLLEPARQLDLLDRFGETDELRETVATLFAKHRAALDAVERTRMAERDRAQREDLLRFQVSELDAARLRVGEEGELRGERQRLQHAERFAHGIAEIAGLLAEDEPSAAGRVARARRVVADLARLDPAFGAVATPLDSAEAHIEDALIALRALRDRAGAEPGGLEAIEDRLDALTRLKRKYGDTEAVMLRFRDEAAAELDRLQRHEELLAAQERALAEVWAELSAAARRLSDRRAGAARKLATAAEREIRTLGMERASFEVAVERAAADAVTARGVDRVELRLAANPGDEPRALARVASGGELSRTMLALHTVLAAEGVATMVFDEVDAGVGGRAAAVVADKLAAAARGRQVLCVTHLAPIAARADHHVRVAKAVRAGRTRVTTAALDGDERVAEVARMLGGEATSEALRHARELLSRGKGGRTRPV